MQGTCRADIFEGTRKVDDKRVQRLKYNLAIVILQRKRKREKEEERERNYSRKSMRIKPGEDA